MRRSAVGAALLVALTGLFVFSARHALIEIWPLRVAELVLVSGELVYVAAPQRAGQKPRDQEVIARSYPRSLLVLESPSGELNYGFAVDYDAQAGLWSIEIEGVVVTVDQATLRRVWSPNSLSLVGRFGMMQERLAERRGGRMLLLAAADSLLDSAESDDL